MRSGVSSVEDDASRRVHVPVDPASPCLQSSSVSFSRVESRVQRVAFLVVVLSVHTVQNSRLISNYDQRRLIIGAAETAQIYQRKPCVPSRRLAVRPPVAGVEDEHVGLLPPVRRLVDAVDLEDRVGVPLPVEAHPFADQEMRPHELHGAAVVLRSFVT